MPVPSDELEALLLKAFPHSSITLEDTMGDQDHYHICIASSQFEGKSRMEQHKLVYDVLRPLLSTCLHAVSIKTSVKGLEGSINSKGDPAP